MPIDPGILVPYMDPYRVVEGINIGKLSRFHVYVNC